MYVNREAFLVQRRPLHGLNYASAVSSTVPVSEACIDGKLERGRRETAGEDGDEDSHIVHWCLRYEH